MKKLIILLLMSSLTLVGCGGGDDKAKEEKKEAKTAETEGTTVNDAGIARIQAQTELGTLGFTTEELKENWNNAQAEMKEDEAYQITDLVVSNGEFKTDVGEGLILEGIVNEDTNEVSKLSIIRKEVEAEKLEQSLDQFEDTLASFFLLVSVTNKDNKVSEAQINSMVHDLVILEKDKDQLDSSATLNNVNYKVVENERGLVLTATENKE
ncbi:hypothetical protein IM538_17030 [Cytobacillus suaedae]|nr:hypothetical protein IM538_17030 [Cytobacillus suaedae]